MGDVQRLTIEGKTYVVLREEAYQDLLDMIEAQAIMGRIAAGEETFPHRLVAELATTTSRIRTFRKYRGLTMAALAREAGISQPHLSDIETGKKNGSIEVLKRIAAALRVDLDDIAG